MAIARDFPYLRSNFNVEIDGIPNVNPVIEVIPPGGHAEIVLYRDGRSPDRFRPLRGIVTLEPVTLRRGFNGQLDLFHWWQEVRAGAPSARRTVAIDLLDEEGQTVARWLLVNAYPSSHRFAPLDACSSEPVVEEVQIVYEDYGLE